MKIIIGQPKQEHQVKQLREVFSRDFDMVLFPEGYLKNKETLNEACKLAKDYHKVIITGYKDSHQKDKAIIIGRDGEKLLDRNKTPVDKPLYEPLVIQLEKLTIAYLLCMEILKGLEGLKQIKEKIDIIFHPIGVGMFSEQQFNEWVSVAKKIAMTYKTKIVGCSHADGSYRNCGVSIPIAYYIDESGYEIFVSKSDTRTRIIDIETSDIKIIL